MLRFVAVIVVTWFSIMVTVRHAFRAVGHGAKRWVALAAAPSDMGDLNDLTVGHLKELLRAAGLPVSGLKKDLIGRLIETFPSFAGGGAATEAGKPPKPAPTRVAISPPLPPPPTDAAACAFVLQFDGGSRGNPGPAGAGSLLLDAATGAVLWEACVYIGPCHTNNVAEYRGAIAGLTQVRHSGREGERERERECGRGERKRGREGEIDRARGGEIEMD